MAGFREAGLRPMCNVHSLTKGQAAIGVLEPSPLQHLFDDLAGGRKDPVQLGPRG